MNAHWESTCAFDKNGTRRDAAHSTRWNRKALARIAVVLRGGTQRDQRRPGEARAARIDRDLPVTTPKLRIVWKPAGFARPTCPATPPRRITRVTHTST